MSTKRENFKKELDELLNNCFKGILHYRAWKTIADELKENETLVNNFNYFWTITLKAHLEAAQLHLLKLFDKSGSSIDIRNFIKSAEQNSDFFIENKLDFLAIELKALNEELDECEDIISNLRTLRNKHFIHLSKEYLFNYDKLYDEYEVIRKNIIELLVICSDVLNTIQEAFDDSTTHMGFYEEQETQELLNFLTHKLEEKSDAG